MFPVQMDVQRARLLGAIVDAIQNFDDSERVDEYLRALGRDHRKFDVRPEHYAQVKARTARRAAEHAGEHWSLVYEQAWSDVYDLIAEQDDRRRRGGRRPTRRTGTPRCSPTSGAAPTSPCSPAARCNR